AFLARAHAIYGSSAYRLFPTLCWLGASDGMLEGLCWAGVVLSLLLLAGVAQVPVLFLLWVCYLSLSGAGQTFLWFQWDALLLETGLLALLFAPTQVLPSLATERPPLAPAQAPPDAPERAPAARARSVARVGAVVQTHGAVGGHEARER